MRVTPVHTRPVTVGTDLFKILDEFLPQLGEDSVVAVTSKIVSLCEKSVRRFGSQTQKRELIHETADLYLDVDSDRPYSLTVKRGILIPNAGIDASNADGHLILWPENPRKSACSIWTYLRKRYKIRHLGVVITDSHTTPGRWGTTGLGIAWCGFLPLTDYVGKPDIFGRRMEVTKRNVLDGLAASAVLVMGEGSEQTPLAVIEEADFVVFTEKPPTGEDEKALRIELSEDLYAPLLTSVRWKKLGRT